MSYKNYKNYSDTDKKRIIHTLYVEEKRASPILPSYLILIPTKSEEML